MASIVLEIPSEIDDIINEISARERIDKGETMKRALALLSIVYEEKWKGNSIGVVRENAVSKELVVVSKVGGL